MVQHGDIDHTGITGVGGGIAATLLDAKGDLIVASAADTAARQAVGTNGTALVARSSATNGVAYETPTGLLAVTRYAPTSQTVYTNATTTLADVDATNLSITFTTPASTNILVRLMGYADISAGTGDGYWGLREGSSDLAFSVGRVIRNQANATICSYDIYLAGVSAGAHTYKWSFAASASTTTRIIIQDGTAVGEWSPGIMQVWVAP